MKVLSIQVGKPQDVLWQGKVISTGIYKSPISGPVMVRKTNIDGDGQADLSVHGGLDKAVYAYSNDAYPWWHQRLGVPSLPRGAFGENLTVEKLDESDFGVGDRYSLGDCELQVVEPRFPCSKLGVKFNDMGIIKTFMESGRPGIYFRVLKEGKIEAGDQFQVLKREATRVSIAEFFDLKVRKLHDESLMRNLLKIPSLTDEWRRKFEKKLRDLSSP